MTERTAPVAPAPARIDVASPRRVLAVLGELLRGERLRSAGVLAVLVVAAAAGLVTPWGLGRMVDIATGGVAGGAPGSAVWRIGAIMAGAAVVGAVATAVGVAATGRLLETVLARVRERMMSAALGLPLSRVERAGTGDLVSRATDDVDVVGAAISRAVPVFATSALAIVLTVLGLGALDPRFLVVAAVVLPVYALAMRMYVRDAPEVYGADRVATARRAHHVLGAVRGRDAVTAFGLANALGAVVARHSWGVVAWSMRARILQNRLWGRVNLAELLGMATILVVGFLLVDAGGVTVGAVTTAMLLFLRMFGPIGALLMVVDDLMSGGVALGRIVGVVDEAERHGPTGTRGRDTGDASAPAVDLRAVGYAYREGRPVLHEVTLAIGVGEHVAIVGTSGAGKSTLAGLVAGVHRPDTGTVRVRGRDPHRAAGTDDRPRTALVTQEFHVFGGTLADDLRMAAPDASDDAVRAALDACGAGEWVDALPDGLATIVGSEGVEVTPLRAQQVALARVVLADPDLVILDEATAEAGSAGARALDRAARAALDGRSALVVAHRLDQAATADRVVVLDAGRIVEEGTHAALVARGGRYATLWESWSRYRGPSESR